ncbi:MAG: hypothetical protein ACI89U_000029 [Gammaproteobacteria bacterium]|jgi:hypothetical protein
MFVQIFLTIGASILGLLGVVHLVFTFFSNRFEPCDGSVAQAMRQTNPVISRETTMWDAWVGFNASHSLGAIMFAAFYIPLALFNLPVITQSLWFTLLPVMVGLAYLALAKRYWFSVPFNGIFMATICFIIAAVLAVF